MEGDLRRIPLSHRSHVTGFQALATGIAEHESALERDFVTLTSWLDAGAVVTAQPITVWFDHDGRRRRYTPDFRVDWSAGGTDIVEIKYRADLRADWPRLRVAFTAARAWADVHGVRFRIATERGIRGAHLDAVKRLLPLRTAPVDAELAALAVERARSAPTFAELAGNLPTTPEVALGVIWRLIARGALAVDLTVPIGPGSPVRAA